MALRQEHLLLQTSRSDSSEQAPCAVALDADIFTYGSCGWWVLLQLLSCNTSERLVNPVSTSCQHRPLRGPLAYHIARRDAAPTTVV